MKNICYKKYVYIILLILLASMLTAGCTGSNSEKTSAQTSGTPAKDQASSQQPAASATSQDTEWKASVQAQYAILKADFDVMSNTTNNYQNLNNSTVDVIGKYGQKIIDDSSKAIEENDKYTVSSNLQDAQTQWGLALKDCKYAGQFWVQSVDDIKNGSTISANMIKAEASTGSGTSNMQRVITSLGST